MAAAIPEGATVSIAASMATPEILNTFSKVVKYGYNQVGTKEMTAIDGSVVNVGIYQRREFTNSQVEKRNFTPESVKKEYDGAFYIFENACKEGC